MCFDNLRRVMCPNRVSSIRPDRIAACHSATSSPIAPTVNPIPARPIGRRPGPAHSPKFDRLTKPSYVRNMPLTIDTTPAVTFHPLFLLTRCTLINSAERIVAKRRNAPSPANPNSNHPIVSPKKVATGSHSETNATRSDRRATVEKALRLLEVMAGGGIDGANPMLNCPSLRTTP